MHTINGIGVFGGIAFGKAEFFQTGDLKVKKHDIEDVEKELEKFEEAVTEAKNQLQVLYKKALEEVGETNAAIFDIHQMMLEDPDFTQSITNIIQTQSVNAEYAVSQTGENFASVFSSMDDDYMKERATDVRDISERLIAVLTGGDLNQIDVGTDVILMAEDLTPSQTVQLEKDKIKAFVTAEGSTNSHTAILARMMNIPAIVSAGDDINESLRGKDVIVDGFTGTIYVDPDQETIQLMQERFEEEKRKKLMLETLKGKENITKDGQKIDVYANIGGISDIASALQNDAGGIGLFRSEFLYLEQDNYPDEETQFKAYKIAAETLAGKRVVIRTLDIGADKQIAYFNLPKEENPAMGYRAIRICLDRQELFKTQLRALLRASSHGKISIMFPMITSLEEILEIKAILADVKRELDSNNISYDSDIEIGVMIETPAAALISDLLAKEVDFFSIGTNDLTQYTLALDRQNPKLKRYYKPHHTALLRMIKMAAENAHKENAWVGICGELAADLELTEFFLAAGIDELSVAPPYILPLREKIRESSIANIKEKIFKEHMTS